MEERRFYRVTAKKTAAEARLPARATKTSAGYDFFLPEDIEIPPQQTVLFPTDVKVKMPEGEMLMIVVRSSAGVKKGLMAANTVGIVDSDYYDNPDNEGNIHIALRNLLPAMELAGYETVTLADGREFNVPVIRDLKEANTVRLCAGERVAQGIFIKVETAQGGSSEASRAGGFGSSGR